MVHELTKEWKKVGSCCVSPRWVLAVEKNCCTGIRALEKGASLFVFSDKTLEEAKGDDFRFDKNYWFNWETI